MSALDSARLRRRVLEKRLVQLETERAAVLTNLHALDGELRELVNDDLLRQRTQVPARMDHDDPRDRAQKEETP